jgi:hypothetical protein
VSAINNPVASDDDFPEVLNPQFRNHATGERKPHQAVSGPEHTIGKGGREAFGRGLYTSKWHQDPPPLAASTLLEPFRHALPDLVLAYELASIRLLDSSLNLLEQVEPIQSVFDACVVR